MSQEEHTVVPLEGADIESIRRNEVGQIVVNLKNGNGPIADAKVARCFPWTLPDQFVSIRDSNGKELALLKTLDELDAASRAVVQQELADKVFNPKIRRIESYKNEFGVVSITAQTDRGLVTFQIRSRDDIRFISPIRALFRDADGTSYELTDIHALDAVSRKAMQEYF